MDSSEQKTQAKSPSPKPKPAAALAAGETPSPDLVAAVGGTSGLSPRVALTILGVVVAGIAFVELVADRVAPFFLELNKPPEVLEHEAKQILDDLGPSAPPADSTYGFFLEGEASGTKRLVFRYRESPRRGVSFLQQIGF
jgi:hypothetical protein